MKKVIEVRDLVRDYKVKHKGKKEVNRAVNNISFDVYEGEVFGLLGPNGAGKTTTIKVLTTMLSPTSGQINILGKDIQKDANTIRSQINFMFGGERGVYGRLTALEYLTYFACLYKVPRHAQKARLEDLLQLVELEDKKDHKIHTFSKGMVQRIQIARSLINQPKILFLDEPTIGLDPIIAEKTRDIIKSLVKQNISIILTTHYMKEADDLCDRLGIISQGEIKAIGTPKSIKDSYSFIHVYESTLRISNERDFAEDGILQHVNQKHIKDDYFLLRFKVDQKYTYEQVREHVGLIGEVITLEQKEITLEDAYINIMKVG
jgi:ABC-2 type transport system ATP-binding protein